MRSAVPLSLGYLRERFSYDDFTAHGFANVLTNATGAYNAALLAGTLWKGYSASIVYVTVNVTF